MSQLRIGRKLPECDRCIFYARDPHVVCTNHPSGVSGNACSDFECDLTVAPEALWEPEGTSYYNGELVVTSEQRWSRLEKLSLLDSHPMFTGRCPQCEAGIALETSRVHWDCEHCGWSDESV